jgi:hypothetical protein
LNRSRSLEFPTAWEAFDRAAIGIACDSFRFPPHPRSPPIKKYAPREESAETPARLNRRQILARLATLAHPHLTRRQQGPTRRDTGAMRGPKILNEPTMNRARTTNELYTTAASALPIPVVTPARIETF